MTLSEVYCFVSAFIMDIIKTLWEPTASMNKARHNHACGVVNQDTILVAGGNDDIGDILHSVEIFSLITMEWVDSTPLPNPLSSEASLQYGNTVLAFGGTSIYHFDETLFEWSVREETLLNERADYIAVPITGTLHYGFAPLYPMPCISYAQYPKISPLYPIF